MPHGDAFNFIEQAAGESAAHQPLPECPAHAPPIPLRFLWQAWTDALGVPAVHNTKLGPAGYLLAAHGEVASATSPLARPLQYVGLHLLRQQAASA